MILTSDNQVYTGITTDMPRRWQAHTSGRAGARYFRGRTPVQLCFLEADHTRSSASKREYALKALSAKAKRTLISQQQSACLLLMEKLGVAHLAHGDKLPVAGQPGLQDE
jgi:putative endonuclease